MIFATKESKDTNCLWIDVKGNAENKHFVPAQAKVALPLIIKEFKNARQDNGIDSLPSLFIISPFKSVKAGIINFLRNGDFLYHQGKSNM